MKIVTVNVPTSYVEGIKRLVGDGGLYPSRSELVRCAVRDFLLKELKMAKKFAKHKHESEEVQKNEDEYVRVPIEKKNKEDQSIREFKTYKIIRRLEC